MTYHLLTGATGLLGSYLLRDCLRRGHRLVVLARPSRRESARDRIEAILARFEAESHMSLARPVVLEGDLTAPNLGLDEAGLQWISRHCRSVIHNAASLTFQGNGPDSEPWHTNLKGTQQVLDLCRTAGIRQFHYVSTAYVCGLREGRVLETELDVGQTPGNDYETSKIQAEQLVRGASWIDPPTIYRPSIIVGDSKTGYTATFHGFYVLVKLAHTLVSRMVFGSTAGRLLVEGMGLSDNDHKNLVPVDWVSAAIEHIFTRPDQHGRTYHLTTPRPPSLVLIADVIQQAVEQYSQLADARDSFVGDGDWFLDSFREQIEIYHSYWRDDPRFDDSQRVAAVPFACPEMDASLLMRLARYAIQSNFGRAQQHKVRLDFDIHRHLQTLPSHGPLASNLAGDYCFGLDIHGPGGGQWKLILCDGRFLETEHGLGPQCSAVFRLDAPTFLALGARKLAAADAVQSGRVVIEGNGLETGQLAAVLQAAATNGVS